MDKYDIGTGFGHFGIAVEDVSSFICIYLLDYISNPLPIKLNYKINVSSLSEEKCFSLSFVSHENMPYLLIFLLVKNLANIQFYILTSPTERCYDIKFYM